MPCCVEEPRPMKHRLRLAPPLGKVIGIHLKRPRRIVQSYLEKMEMVLENKLEKEDINKKIKNIIKIRFSPIRMSFILIINPLFVKDFVDIYGDLFLGSILIGKSLADLLERTESKAESLAKTWF